MTAFSFLTTHFFDYEWTSLLAQRLSQTVPSSATVQFLVIDQDRTADSARRLAALVPHATVLQFPRSQRHFERMGHDHAFVLNEAIKHVAGDLLVVFDSDAHPYTDDWLGTTVALLSDVDAVLAEDHLRPGFPHPCFMALKRHCLDALCFDEGLFENGVDTGRLLHQQLARAGQRAILAPPTPAFPGGWGQTYLGCVYHHGSGSFAGAGPELRKQVRRGAECYRRMILERGRYDVPFLAGDGLRDSSVGGVCAYVRAEGEARYARGERFALSSLARSVSEGIAAVASAQARRGHCRIAARCVGGISSVMAEAYLAFYQIRHRLGRPGSLGCRLD